MLIKKVTELLEKLEALGSADQIRDYFVQEQIHGLRWMERACPVHTYLVHRLHCSSEQIRVSGVQARVSHSVCTDSRVMLPREVATFVRNFDCAQYPELYLH